MSLCSSCGIEVPEGKTMCKPCRENLMSSIWKRQIRTYAVIVALGLVMVIYSYSQFVDHHYHIDDAPQMLKAAFILGGLGLMGGLFGMGLALFFSIWHGKAR